MMDADKISEEDWEKQKTFEIWGDVLDTDCIMGENKKIRYQKYREKLKPKKVIRKFFIRIRNNLK